ncbi:MAG: c-type cytochrome [Terriglobales bacterium]
MSGQASGDQSKQPTQPSIKSLIGFALVVLVAGYFIYAAFGGEYLKSSFEARFDFHKPAPPGTAEQVDLHQYLKATPQLLTEGQQVYSANCVPCHGAQGYGNGPRGAGLNPPPRNYHTGVFKFGTSVLAMYHTVTNGSPGTAMPSFIALSPEERFSVVHFIRANFIPKDALQANTDAQLAAIATPAAAGAAKLPPLNAVPTGPRIPIAVAMQIVAQQASAAPAGPPPSKNDPPAPDVAVGQALYQHRCQSCHGDQGQGGIPIEMITSAPYVEVTAAAFRQPHMLTSINDTAGFDKIVLHGLPGRMMTGQGTLTKAQLDGLQAYVQELGEKGEAQ